MTKKIALTLFLGFEGAGVALRRIGYEVVSGPEINPRVAEVARLNGFDGRVGDILDANPYDYPVPDLLHMSPPCTRASVANKSAEVNEDGIRESPLDIALATACADFIRVLRPRCITLENVPGYVHFKSFQMILRAIENAGYFYDYQNQNSADYGVPQTRRRLYLRASLDLLPPLPAPVEWRGWYGAIEDLIPVLPVSAFAKWQLDKIAMRNLLTDFLMPCVNADGTSPPRRGEFPAQTIGAQVKKPYRAFLVDARNGRVDREDGLTAGLTSIVDSRPSFTVNSTNNPNRYRAFLVSDQKSGRNNALIAGSDSPANTVDTRPSNKTRAFIIDGKPHNHAGDLRIIPGCDPVVTVTQSQTRHPFRALLEQGRVVALSARAIARLQGFPDSYRLPETESPRKLANKDKLAEKSEMDCNDPRVLEWLTTDDELACLGIGNAVAGQHYEAICRGFYERDN